MDDVTVGIFRKLIESLVESTMMYGAEVWDLVPIEQVQLRALRMFLEWAHFTPSYLYC